MAKEGSVKGEARDSGRQIGYHYQLEINIMKDTIHPVEIFPCHMTNALCQHLKAGRSRLQQRSESISRRLGSAGCVNYVCASNLCAVGN
ncbi:hypothetical protein E2C01_046666 [Portunus trituberculatus]|uniref:Uncharacterized protein n=1 Tax=Portunus trituberculatus TaxID=210409 RepID=A0A5B7G5D5_PORTR|nr:hypothetical protein [Portunus trituberculatus]